MVLRINEIVVSTTGVDREFIELFGTPGTTLDGVSLLQVQPGGEISQVIDFSGRIGVNGHFLAASPEAEAVLGVEGNQQIADNTFPNASRTYLLVQDFTGEVGDDIDGDDDGAVDRVPWAFIHDSVAPIDNDAPLIYSPNVVGPDGAFLSPGGYRDPAGTGSFVQHDFFDPSLYTPTAGSDVLINEIVVSTTGSDREFLELVGLPGTDLSGMSLLEILPGGEVDAVIGLTGSIGGNGYYLLTSPTAETVLGVEGDQAFPDNTFTNGSRTYLLVEGFTGVSGDDIDADDDGEIDNAPWSGIVDGVAPIDNDSPLIYTSNVVGPDGSFLAAGGFRDPAAGREFVLHDFFDPAAYTPTASAPFAINEIVVSTTGVDAEFLEIVGLPGADLSTFSILEILPGGEIDTVIDLTGATGENGYYLLASPTAEDRFFLIADQQIADNTFSNGSRTYLMVQGFSGASGDDIDANDDGLIDFAPWADITDSVAPIDNDSPLIYSANVIGPDGAFLAAGGYRDPERIGSFVMHDFFDLDTYTPQSGNDARPLVINEILVSSTGTDTEFLELFGEPGADLSGHAILEIEPGGEIDTIISLTGRVGDNGYYLLTTPEAVSRLGVIGDQMIADNTFSNASRTYLLVEGFSGASGDDIDANDDGLVDVAPWAEITDSVAPIDNDSPLIYSANVVGPDGAFLAAGGYRDPEGSGAFVMHDFFDPSLYTPTAGTFLPSVSINEISVSTTGTDREFLELLGDPSTSLDTMSVLEIRSGGEVDNVISLAGFQTGDNGYFLLASPTAEAGFGVTANLAIPDNTFTNASRTYLLVEDFSGAIGDDIDADNDGVVDNPLWTGIVDGVAPIDDDLPSVYTNNVVGPDGAFLAPGGYRLPDRSGPFEMHDFSDFAVYTPTAGTGETTIGGGGPTEVLISAIQGPGDTSPLAGSEVTVEAIVVGDFQNGDGDGLRNLGGFYLQEEAADHDADAATSEGIFVFDGALGVDVALGDRVRVTGTVNEFFGQTQINATAITVTAAGAVADVNTMAASVTLDTIDGVITDNAGNYAPDLEAYEGMLATFTDTLTVNEMFQLDRFNEIRLSANGRPEQFTQVSDPDPAAYDAYQRAAGSDQVVFDDGLNLQNAAILPEADLNGDGVFDTADGFTMGDTITGLTGVVTYTWAGNAASAETWRIRSVDDGNAFTDTNTRDTAPPDVGGSLTVASFNVLNFFTTLDVPGNPGAGPSLSDPRGADNLDEFNRQLDKLLTALEEMDADIYGLIELENEFTFDQNGDGLVAVDFLVDQLNARIGSITYAAVDIGRGFVDVSDAISVGLIYDVTTVGLVPGSVRILDDSVLPGLSGGHTGPLFDGPDTNRAPLAATFTDLASGEDFTIAVTHMKSKGGSGTGDDADAGDGAGAFNATRTEGVAALTEWLATFADDDLLVIGDFNAYAQEDPIDAMLAAGYADLGATYSPGQPGYVFDGKTGTLDYAFGSGGLMDNVTGAAPWTINSDEPDAIDYNTDFGRDPAIFDGGVPFRASDHDPILVGLDFAPPEPERLFVLGTEGRDRLQGTAADETIVGLGGYGDLLSGGAGADAFYFNTAGDGARDYARITDFEAGIDSILMQTPDFSVALTSRYARIDAGPEHDLVLIYGSYASEGELNISVADIDDLFVV